MEEPESEQPDKYAIHAAAREGRIQAVEALLSANPRLSQQRDQDDRLPLHWASAYAHLPIIKLLSSQKSFDPDVVDASGWTPLIIAASLPNNAGLEIIEFLFTKEAEVKTQTSSGATALHLATSKQNLEVCKLLLKNGASARVKDKRGQLSLHRAAAVGSLPITKLLLEARSPVNASDVDGMTALHQALSEGHGDVAVELLRAGAEGDRRDSESRTALDCAPDSKVREFVKSWAEREGVDLGEA